MLNEGPNAKTQNIKAIVKHQRDPIHKKVDATMELYQVETKEQFFEVLKSIHAELIKATAHQFENILYEVFTGSPYEDHPVMTKLQTRHGAILGEHLHSRFSATLMTDYIADKVFNFKNVRFFQHYIVKNIF